MKPTYSIKDWDRIFETSESRKIVNARWVPVPNKQDGKGYRRVAQHRNGVAIFCAWSLILEVASKMPVRGTLSDHDGPLDAEDLAAKTGFPVKIFEQALEFLSDSRVGWITTDNVYPAKLAESPRTPADSAEVSATSSPEGNGIERKGREDKESRSKAALVRQVFEFWKTEMKHPKAQLTPERKRKIEERLADSTVEEIETAIRGCKASDFHMGREHGHPQVFDDIELICRKRSKLESFIAKAPPAPRPVRTETIRERMARENCELCFGTGTDTNNPKGARPCDHGLNTNNGSSAAVESAAKHSEARVS